MNDNTIILGLETYDSFDWQKVLEKSRVLKQSQFSRCFEYKNIATISASGKYFCVHPFARKCMDELKPILEDSISSYFKKEVVLNVEYSVYGSIEKIIIEFGV